jgi:acetyl-CoA synthetase
MATPRADAVAVIRKDPQSLPVRPNVVDYEAVKAGFRRDAARSALDGLPGGRGLNIAYECVDRHAPAMGRRVPRRRLLNTS